jgi:hypothetical protein
MTLRRTGLLIALIGLTLIPVTESFAIRARAADKVDEIGAYAESGASEALKKTLEPKGWRVSLADGAYCDIWLRASVPAGKIEEQGAVYTNFGESTLIGVITFARTTTDFRGQTVKAGSYTMRSALHPADGNHLGISPIRDFLVMLPVAMDPNPDATFKFEELTKMSTKVTGTSHPGVLSLVQSGGPATTPKVETNEQHHVVFSATLKSGAPIAFVVKGRAEQ